MTKEQLDAMRTRFNKFYGISSEDAALLLAEVERLNALGALLSADIQRLTRRVAEDEADWMALRAEAATAFARGAAAMREAAASYLVFENRPHYAEEVLSLPIPEYNNGK